MPSCEMIGGPMSLYDRYEKTEIEQRCPGCFGIFFLPPDTYRCPWCRCRLGRTGRSAAQAKLQVVTGRLRSIVERDGWDCWLCSQTVDPYDGGIHRASADHVIPQSEGGANFLWNVRLAHQSCNAYRARAKTIPFAPFDNSAAADRERRDTHDHRLL